MFTAIATLQTAARRLQVSGGLDQPGYSRVMAQLQDVSRELTGLERRAATQSADPVDFTAMLRELAPPIVPADSEEATASAPQVPEGLVIEGPAEGLRDALSGLIEYALTVGRQRLELCARTGDTSRHGRPICAIDLAVRSPDVPDFLRRKLWDAVRARRGEFSVISEPELCRVEFTLPIERRLEPVHG